jgi:hypothetical protein
MKTEDLIEALACECPKAYLLTGYEKAIIGICARNDVIVYSYELIIDTLKNDMSEEEAIEFFEYNILGLFLGEGTPIIMKSVEYL